MSNYLFTEEVAKGSKNSTLVRMVQSVVGVQQTGVFGETTEQFVKKWQKAHKVQETGKVGPTTWLAMFANKAIKQKALQVATSQIGVQESGWNRGKDVDKYNMACLGVVGVAWCASFVYWCYLQAARSLGLKMPWIRSGYVPDLYRRAVQNNSLTRKPQPGDVFLIKSEDGLHSHTGFVVREGANGWVETIEGNTSVSGSSEGDGVYRRIRKKITMDFISLK